MTNLLSREGIKSIGVTKSIFSTEFVLTLFVSTRVFHKKNNLTFVFRHILRPFVNVRYIVDNCRSQGLLFEE